MSPLSTVRTSHPRCRAPRARSVEVGEAISVLRSAPHASPLDDRSSAALAELYSAFSDPLHRTLMRFVGAEADDILHDVFAALPTIIRQWSGGSFSAWLYQVAVNKARMFLRHQRRIECTGEVADVASSSDCSEAFVARDVIAYAAQSLPPSLRRVVELRYVEERSHQEIARLLNITVTASELRLFRALRRMRARVVPMKRAN